MTKIKICGLRTMQDVAYANQVMPEYIGFVFAPSKRQVTHEQARRMRAQLDPKIQAVGVFVNESIDVITQLCLAHTIELIQLHGEESTEYIQQLKERVQRPIIKAIRVQGEEEVLLAEGIDAEYILLDSYVEGVYGGTGQTLHWSVLPKIATPLFVAGGITAENVRVVMEVLQPYCIDVSSGVETNGSKDYDKMLKLVSMVRMGRRSENE